MTELLLNARIAVALLAGLYLVVTLVRRFRSATDPSLRYRSSSAGGSMSVMLSGVHVTMLLAGVIAVATWPLVAENTTLAVALGGAVVGHYIFEEREDRRAAS